MKMNVDMNGGRRDPSGLVSQGIDPEATPSFGFWPLGYFGFSEKVEHSLL